MKFPLDGRTIEDSGIVVFDDDGLMELFYNGNIPSSVVARKSDELDKYNEFCEYFNLPLDVISDIESLSIDTKEIDSHLINEWMIPDKYHDLNVKEYVNNLCKTEEEVKRVEIEFSLYEKRDMLDLLKCLIYLVDFMRENDIVWGVGRGSSVSSYILYLIGLHKVDSLKYDLDIREFLR